MTRTLRSLGRSARTAGTTISVVAIVTILAACSSAKSGATPAANSGPKVGRLGQALDAGGASVKVSALSQHVTAAPQFGQPPVGAQWAALLVQVCAAGGAPVHVAPTEFMLQQRNNVQVAPTIDLGVVGKPALQETTVTPGRCVQGWVFFAPTGDPIGAVDPTANARWTI